MAAIANLIRAPQAHVPVVQTADLPDIDFDGLQLRIVDQIEPGMGVVPVSGRDLGSHLLQNGEIAVYDDDWREKLSRGEVDLEAGLYCYEWQRPPSSMPNRMIAERFADDDPVYMEIERTIAFVFPHPRNPEHWAYRELRSRVHRGVRLTARTEGPIYRWGILRHLRGPIVGIYRPRFGEVA